MRFLQRWFKDPPFRDQAASLYGTVVAQARKPVFYDEWGVPDTPNGRFDMVAVHAFLLLHRLKREHAQATELAQAVFDHMFDDMDQNLREMGVSDVRIGTRVKDLAKAFLGRIAAYEEGLGESADDSLTAALRRNVYRDVTEPAPEHLAALARYMRRQEDALDGQPVEDLLDGRVTFLAAPGGSAETGSAS